jgi:3-phenylpropionate/trans-cinnamate dioxygenase ferredoxin subunit
VALAIAQGNGGVFHETGISDLAASRRASHFSQQTRAFGMTEGGWRPILQENALNATWHAVCRVDAFPAEGKLALVIAQWNLLILREGDAFFAYNDRCPHQAALLSPGKVRRGTIMCPLHGARFKSDTGECIGGAYPSLRGFPVQVTDGAVRVELPDEPPGPADAPLVAP